MELSDKERRVLEYIERCIDENGYPPTVRDICKNTGIKSTSTAYAYVGILENKGLIVRNAGKSRAVFPTNTDSANKTIRIPVLGRITAGAPTFAIENNEGYVSFDPQGKIYVKSELFALKVRGTSMVDAGILDGDFVIVRKQETADNGDIVAALVGDDATVKEFYKESGHFRLQPRNREMSPIIVDDVIILGVVVANIRYY